jgi:hypothetical protein
MENYLSLCLNHDIVNTMYMFLKNYDYKLHTSVFVDEKLSK